MRNLSWLSYFVWAALFLIGSVPVAWGAEAGDPPAGPRAAFSPEEAQFLREERIRFNDLSLKILTEQGIEVDLPDDFDGMVAVLIDFINRDLRGLQDEIQRLYEEARRSGLARIKNWDIDIKTRRVNGGNIALGRIHILLKDGRLVTHDFRGLGGNMFFSSGKAGIFTDPIPAGRKPPNKVVNTPGGNSVYFCDSAQAATTDDKHALLWFKNLIRENRNLYRYVYEQRRGFRIEEADQKRANEHIRELFFHSENAILLYIIRNLDDILAIPPGGPGGGIGRGDIQCLIIDIATDRDMCDTCFKTMGRISRKRGSIPDFAGLEVIVRVVGTRAHEVGRYHSRTDDGRRITEKNPLDFHDVIPQIGFKDSNMYVKNIRR